MQLKINNINLSVHVAHINSTEIAQLVFLVFLMILELLLLWMSDELVHLHWLPYAMKTVHAHNNWIPMELTCIATNKQDGVMGEFIAITTKIQALHLRLQGLNNTVQIVDKPVHLLATLHAVVSHLHQVQNVIDPALTVTRLDVLSR
jgi:hypothetical protein